MTVFFFLWEVRIYYYKIKIEKGIHEGKYWTSDLWIHLINSFSCANSPLNPFYQELKLHTFLLNVTSQFSLDIKSEKLTFLAEGRVVSRTTTMCTFSSVPVTVTHICTLTTFLLASSTILSKITIWRNKWNNNRHCHNVLHHSSKQEIK